MSWAQRRRLLYITGIVIFLIIFVVIPLVIHFYKPPTCFDGKQNQDELGVDCGGVCTLLCKSQYVSLNVLWPSFSKVSDGVYNVMAYIENPNFNAGANNLSYIFKLYNKDGILLKERTGQTFIPPNKEVAIFEPDMQTGNQIPTRVEFAFTSSAIWLKQESAETGLNVQKTILSKEDAAPRLTATIINKTVKEIKNIEAVAIVYNKDGNTIAFSRYIIDSIMGKETQEINFNWPKPFTLREQLDSAATTEIVLKILK